MFKNYQRNYLMFFLAKSTIFWGNKRASILIYVVISEKGVFSGSTGWNLYKSKQNFLYSYVAFIIISAKCLQVYLIFSKEKGSKKSKINSKIWWFCFNKTYLELVLFSLFSAFKLF